MADPREEKLRAELEEIGEEAFRVRWRAGKYGASHHAEWGIANALLKGKAEERAAAGRKADLAISDEQIQEAREANRIAKEANETSKEANRVAFAAFVMAAIALALSLYLF